MLPQGHSSKIPWSCCRKWRDQEMQREEHECHETLRASIWVSRLCTNRVWLSRVRVCSPCVFAFRTIFSTLPRMRSRVFPETPTHFSHCKESLPEVADWQHLKRQALASLGYRPDNSHTMKFFFVGRAPNVSLCFSQLPALSNSVSAGAS